MVGSKEEYYRKNLESVLKRQAEYCNANPEDIENFSLRGISFEGLESQNPDDANCFIESVKSLLSYQRMMRNSGVHHIVEEGKGRVDLGLQSYEPKSPMDLVSSLVWGHDVFRSAFDDKFVLGILDVEYLNYDYLGESYLDTNRALSKVEQLLQVVLQIFNNYGMQPLCLQTGNGVHIATQVKKGSEAYDLLVKLGCPERVLCDVGDESVGIYKHPPEGWPVISTKDGFAWDGMGRIMEYFSQLIIQELDKRRLSEPNILPVFINGITPGFSPYEGSRGREALVLDLSCFTDPIFMRCNRMPFSIHQKSLLRAAQIGEHIANHTPLPVVLPRTNIPLEVCLEDRRDFERAASYIDSVNCVIPDCSKSYVVAIEEYLCGQRLPLFEFHTFFDLGQAYLPQEWGETYHRWNTDVPCIQKIISDSDNQLRDNTQIQAATRFFLKWGIHPKHIAGWMTSCFVNDSRQDYWRKYNPATTANASVRIYAGLIYTGVDDLGDFNCVSHQERGRCPMINEGGNCDKNLEEFKFDSSDFRNDIRNFLKSRM